MIPPPAPPPTQAGVEHSPGHSYDFCLWRDLLLALLSNVCVVVHFLMGFCRFGVSAFRASRASELMDSGIQGEAIGSDVQMFFASASSILHTWYG